jgi:hypothetical protein
MWSSSVSRNCRFNAASKARDILDSAMVAYHDDTEHLLRFEYFHYSPAAEASVMLALHKLESAIKHPHRCDREDMLTGYAFARLGERLSGRRLIALLVACRAIHDDTGQIERTVDAAALFTDMQTSSFWSKELDARIEAYKIEQRDAYVIADMPHGPRQALAELRLCLRRYRPYRPADLERIASLAGLIRPGTRIRGLERTTVVRAWRAA